MNEARGYHGVTDDTCPPCYGEQSTLHRHQMK